MMTKGKHVENDFKNRTNKDIDNMVFVEPCLPASPPFLAACPQYFDI